MRIIRPSIGRIVLVCDVYNPEGVPTVVMEVGTDPLNVRVAYIDDDYSEWVGYGASSIGRTPGDHWWHYPPEEYRTIEVPNDGGSL